MKVYTKTGDNGTTALFGGTRVPKDHARIESYGTVDELNSHIGLIRDQELNQHYKEILIEIQDRLFTVGAILATPPEKELLKNGEKRLQNLGDYRLRHRTSRKRNRCYGRCASANDTLYTSRRTHNCVILSHCSLRLPSRRAFISTFKS